MARVTIGGGNTRVGEVYLDALFRQRALDQEQNRVNMQARIEQQRIMRDAADQEMRARESALQRAQQMQMARESQAFSARESAAQRAFDADKLAQMQAFEEEKMGKQNTAEEAKLKLMDKLESKRWDAQNRKLKEQKDAEYEREELGKAKAEAAKFGIALDKNATLVDVYSGLAAKANELEKKKDQDKVWEAAASLGATDESMPEKWRKMAEAVKKEKDYLRAREDAKEGLLPENHPVLLANPEIAEMNAIGVNRRKTEDSFKNQELLARRVSIEQKINEGASASAERAVESWTRANKNNLSMTPIEIEEKQNSIRNNEFNRYRNEQMKSYSKAFGIPYEEPTQEEPEVRDAESLFSGQRKLDPKFLSPKQKELGKKFESYMQTRERARNPVLSRLPLPSIFFLQDLLPGQRGSQQRYNQNEFAATEAMKAESASPWDIEQAKWAWQVQNTPNHAPAFEAMRRAFEEQQRRLEEIDQRLSE